MDIVSLSSEAFRNLASARVEFHPRLNLIVGDNGHGKTNLLEALAVVSGRPSFKTSDLSEVRQNLASRAMLTARVRGDSKAREGTLGAVVTGASREHYWDGRKISRLQASRSMPAVFLTARDLTRLSGPPSERRRALDRAALAQEADYARTFHAYEKARAAKTRLLSLGNRFDADELAVYESTLCEAGARIGEARRRVVQRLGEELAAQAEALGTPFRRLSLELVSDLPADGPAPVLLEAMRERMRAKKTEERRAARCLVGPHRDDVVLKSEGVSVSSRASSGETRTFVLAWTLAEITLVSAASGTDPILGFDDFDSEWDPHVLAAFAEALPEVGQVFLTSARPDAVRGLPLPEGAIHRMTAGRLSREGVLGGARRPSRVVRLERVNG